MRPIDADAASLSTYNEPYWTESEAAAIRLFLVKQPTIDPEALAEHLRSCGYEVRKCQH